MTFGDERLPPRFWSKVRVNAETFCWEWTAAKNAKGYGILRREGRFARAHRVSYLTCFGSIPEGLQLDHLCMVKHCVNPAHLDPVTAAENIRRCPTSNGKKTHCSNGHPFDGSHRRRGRRCCRACDAARARRRKTGRQAAT